MLTDLEAIVKENKLIECITHERKQQQFAQTDVAVKAELNHQAISMMENLDNSPSLRTLIKYLDVLSLSIQIINKNTKGVIYDTSCEEAQSSKQNGETVECVDCGKTFIFTSKYFMSEDFGDKCPDCYNKSFNK